MILFVIACVCGLVASIGVSQYMERAAGSMGDQVATQEIFVAMADINIGEELNAQNIKMEEWPKDRVPAGAISVLEDIEGRFPRTRLYAGEPILVAKLMDSNDGSKSVDIPKGYRVVSVKVSVESSVSGLVQPGDRVDLMVYLRKNSEVPETGTKTILRDVNVFAVDAETERRMDADGQARDVRTVSLLVQPDQAESVMLASELGMLYLSLRRPDDDSEDDSEGVTIKQLLGDEPESANDKKPQVATQDGGPGFVQWLSSSAMAAAAQSMTGNLVPAAPEPVWTMKIMTPDGHREYQWSDANELPDEVIPGAEPREPAPPVMVPETSDWPPTVDTAAEEPLPAPGVELPPSDAT
jgi:pilus assembly protein CpaB